MLWIVILGGLLVMMGQQDRFRSVVLLLPHLPR
jgi:hypothetical protein